MYNKIWRKAFSVALSLAMLLSICVMPAFASTTPKPITPGGILNFQIAKQTELESTLLLQNRVRADGEALTLPLSKTADKVAVFGYGQKSPIRGSSGSGTVAGAFTYTLIDGLSEIGAPYDTELASFYSRTTAHRWTTTDADKWGRSQQSGTGWNRSSPIASPEYKIDDGLVTEDGLVAGAVAAGANVALIYLSRNVGTEEMDRAANPPQPSDWYLNPSEKTLLKQVADKFNDIVLIVNTAGQIDMTWLDFSWLVTDPDYSDGGKYTQADADARAKKIRSIIWVYGAGSYHGLVLAELMYGMENFSAKLADTVTHDYYDHFSSDKFGGNQTYAANGVKNGFGGNGENYGTRWGGTDPVSIYSEHVYSGHRYFDTFLGDVAGTQADPVLFPFGFGMSYSDFTFSDYTVRFDAESESFDVSAKITNTTSNDTLPSGKEVMEVYVSAPNDKTLDQPYQTLAGYNKTEKLAKGQDETLTVNVPAYYLASYDETSASYILEAGDYYFRIGNSSRNTRIGGVVKVAEKITVEKLQNKLSLNAAGGDNNQAEFEDVRLNSRKASKMLVNANDVADIAECAPVSLSQSQITTRIADYGITEFTPGTAPLDKAYTLQAVADGDITVEDFTAQMTKDELSALLTGGFNTSANAQNPFRYYTDDAGVELVGAGALSKSSGSNQRVGGAGSSRNIRRLGIPSVTYADGGSGISISTAIANNLGYDPNAGYHRPAGAACTWNPKLQEEWGQAIGRDMVSINVDIWLAPSINLHRNPLNGRNTEYYSEDPMLSGLVAAYVSKGVASRGVTVCLKHFAGNDQEQYRRGFYTPASLAAGTSKDAINTINSERGIREVTLKAFEIPVRTGYVRCVMSAFNKINSQECAASKDLLTDILRAEWGFKGYVVTDWGDYDDIAHAANEMRSGNDMIMSGTHTRYSIPAQLYNGIVKEYDMTSDNPYGGRDDGLVSMADMRRNAANVCYTILNSKVAFNEGKYNTGNIGTGSIAYHLKRNLEILSTGLPDAYVGHDYRENKANPILAVGNEGTKFYKFSVAGDSASPLPAGMTLNGNGTITGVPATPGTYNIEFCVEDSDGNTATKALTLRVLYMQITNGTLANPRIGSAYSQPISVGGGSAPYTFALDTEKGSALPKGLTMDPATGIISGTPSDASEIGKSFKLVLTVMDNAGITASATFDIVLQDYITVRIGSFVSPTALAVGQNIGNNTISATRSDGDTFTYSATGLPAGLTVTSGNARLSGTVTAEPGTYDAVFTVTLTSDPSIFIEVPFTFIVYSAGSELTFISRELPVAKAGVSYSVPTPAAGGTGTKAYSFNPDSEKPAGLSINASTGQITWTPGGTQYGLHRLMIDVADSESKITGTFWLMVDAGISMIPETGSIFNAKADAPFSGQVAAVGYTTYVEYRVSDKGDALPEGITIDLTSGELSGTPKIAGVYNVIIEANEIGGAFSGAMAAYTIIVGNADDNAITNVTVGVEQLVATCAANVPVTVEGDNLGSVNIKIVSKDGVVYGEANMAGAGKAVVRIDAAKNIAAGTYDVIVACGSSSKSAELKVVPYNADIWTVQIDKSVENKTSFIFADDISPAGKGYAVKAGNQSFIPVQVGNVLSIDYTAQAGDVFVISGVKYPTLFPSYSFTFTVM